MPVYTITIERISTGERSPSMVTRQSNEAEARAYAATAIAVQHDATDLRVYSVTSREESDYGQQ